MATTPAATLAPANLNPNISVATPTAKNTKIAVPRNSAANFRIIAPPLMPELRTDAYVITFATLLHGQRPNTGQRGHQAR